MASPVRTFRLADDLWSRLLVAANAADLTPAAFVAKTLCDALEPEANATPRAAPSTRPRVQVAEVSAIKRGAYDLAVGPVARKPGSMLKGGKK